MKQPSRFLGHPDLLGCQESQAHLGKEVHWAKCPSTTRRLEFRLSKGRQVQLDPRVPSDLQEKEAKGAKEESLDGLLVLECREGPDKKESRDSWALMATRAKKGTMACMEKWDWLVQGDPLVPLVLTENQDIRVHLGCLANQVFLAPKGI